MMRYQLVRSKRKTLALSLRRDGSLTVRAPLQLPLARIEAFVDQKWDWVQKTRERLAQQPKGMTLQLEEGASIPYLGGTLTLAMSNVPAVRIAADRLLIPSHTKDLSPVLRFFDKQARMMLEERVRVISQAVRLYPKTIRLSHAKSRWGSMSGHGTLSLNRALLHCPPDVVDYVILHELCHIPHPNHSPAFWRTVESFLPQYHARRAWLKEHSAFIAILPART